MGELGDIYEGHLKRSYLFFVGGVVRFDGFHTFFRRATARRGAAAAPRSWRAASCACRPAAGGSPSPSRRAGAGWRGTTRAPTRRQSRSPTRRLQRRSRRRLLRTRRRLRREAGGGRSRGRTERRLDGLEGLVRHEVEAAEVLTIGPLLVLWQEGEGWYATDLGRARAATGRSPWWAG